MQTLEELVHRDGPLNELDAVGWAIRVAKCVEQLHKLGVAHGGISAACVSVQGTARGSHGQLADVREAATMPGYHSPERHGGQGISPADDTWALAVTLYFTLTGSVPFAGQTAEQIRHRITTTAAAPLAVFDVGDDELQRILDSFLAKNISQRVVTADRFCSALQEWHPDPQVAQLLPLAEAEEDTFTDDDSEDDVATVMRDFSEVQAHIDALRAQGKAPGLVDLPAREPAAGRIGRPPPAAGRIGVPPPVAGLAPRAGSAPAGGPPRPPPPRSQYATNVGGFTAPVGVAAPVPRQKQDTPLGGFAPAPGGSGVTHEPPPTAMHAEHVGVSDENAATIMLDAAAPDLSAAIEEALALKQENSAPPGWPPSPGLAAVREEPGQQKPIDAVFNGPGHEPPPAALHSPDAGAIAKPRKSSLGKVLVIALVVLVLVIAAVGVLYMRRRGMISI